ncbi:low temperature requirement protein A [Micromonospora sp. NPDC049102]|uniref:low temperature requirement protein A n=1 Tax=Micromonospora sp. NPDC049102 TaxID=3364265 RepID=UPI0037247E9E
MTTGGTAALVRRPDGSTRATLLELLFDVVFVAALAQTSKLLADQQSWARSAAVALMLTAIWWTWSVTTTTTEFYDPQQRPIQGILMIAMVGSVGMAAALPMITRGQAATFALAYVGTHVVRGIILVSTLYRQRHRASHPIPVLVPAVRRPLDNRRAVRRGTVVDLDHRDRDRPALRGGALPRTGAGSGASGPVRPDHRLPWAGGWPPVLVTAIVALALAGHVVVPGAGDRETTRGLRPRKLAG